MRYKTNDGELITGANARELIQALRTLSRDPEPTTKAFMIAMAERAKQQIGMNLVPTDTEEGFILGLVEAGLLKEEGD